MRTEEQHTALRCDPDTVTVDRNRAPKTRLRTGRQQNDAERAGRPIKQIRACFALGAHKQPGGVSVQCVAEAALLHRLRAVDAVPQRSAGRVEQVDDARIAGRPVGGRTANRDDPTAQRDRFAESLAGVGRGKLTRRIAERVRIPRAPTAGHQEAENQCRHQPCRYQPFCHHRVPPEPCHCVPNGGCGNDPRVTRARIMLGCHETPDETPQLGSWFWPHCLRRWRRGQN